MTYYCQYCGYVLNGKTTAEAESHVNGCFIKSNRSYQERCKQGIAGADPYKENTNDAEDR